MKVAEIPRPMPKSQANPKGQGPTLNIELTKH